MDFDFLQLRVFNSSMSRSPSSALLRAVVEHLDSLRPHRPATTEALRQQLIRFLNLSTISGHLTSPGSVMHALDHVAEYLQYANGAVLYSSPDGSKVGGLVRRTGGSGEDSKAASMGESKRESRRESSSGLATADSTARECSDGIEWLCPDSKAHYAVRCLRLQFAVWW